jgi:hypothetical protein
MNKKIISIASSLALISSVALFVPVFAQTNTSQSQNDNERGQFRAGMPNGMNRGLGIVKPGVSGTVTAVNGNIININGRKEFGTTTTVVNYSIDATNATVKKNNATSTVSSIVVGDMIFVQGTVTGNNVVATTIIDGMMIGRMNGNKGPNESETENRPRMASSTEQVIGNGQPVLAGTISVINGANLTVTTASNVTYSIDASKAKVLHGQNTVALSNIAVGDKVVVQGSINGTSVIASTVIDQNVPSAIPTSNKGQSRGFFGGIGQFFAHLFGF